MEYQINDMSTQIHIIRNELNAGRSVTSYEAFTKWKMTRLSSIIYILIHRDGMHIVGEMELNLNTNKRYKRYRLG